MSLRKRGGRRASGQAEVGAGAEHEARVTELQERWYALKKWGVAEKLKHTAETQKAVETFLDGWRKGEKDKAQVSPTTSDVRRLELEAEEYDKVRGVKPPFLSPGWAKALVNVESGNASPEAQARVTELMGRWDKLTQWGISSKIPRTSETQADVAAFFVNWKSGSQDVTQVSGVTSDIRRLELEAEEYDKVRGVKPPFLSPGWAASPFDVEKGTAGLEAAAAVRDAGKAAVDVGRELARDVKNELQSGAAQIPVWVWFVAAGVGGLFLVRELRRGAEAGTKALELYRETPKQR